MQSGQSFLITLVLAAFLCASAHSSEPNERATSANSSGAPNASSAKPKTEEAEITEQLASTDTALHDLAVERMKQLLANRSRQKLKFNATWVRRLADLKRFQDADDVAVLGIINARTDLIRISAIQSARVNAFLAAGNMEAALSAAKGYYNLCGMAETEGAINLMAKVLVQARPNGSEIARRFKAEQLAGAATTQPATSPIAGGQSTLETITIVSLPFQEFAEELSRAPYENAIAKGNLLLLCDRGAEARECFEGARKLAKGEKQLVYAIEGIARSIRAEAGSVGPANAFVLAAQQGK